MTGTNFIQSVLALRCWIHGREDGLNAMLGIAFVYRNRVRAGWESGDWIKVLQNYRNAAATEYIPTDEIPDPRSLNFSILLQTISSIIDGTAVDKITVAGDLAYGSGSVLSVSPPPALYYGRLNEITRDWFLENISRNENHRRLGNVANMWFWA